MFLLGEELHGSFLAGISGPSFFEIRVLPLVCGSQHLFVLLHQPLASQHSRWVVLRNLGGHLECLRLDCLLIGENPVQKAHSLKVRGRYFLSQENHVSSKSLTQIAREEETRTAFRALSKLNEVGLKSGVSRGVDEVTEEEGGGGDAHGRTSHRRNDWLVAVDESLDELLTEESASSSAISLIFEDGCRHQVLEIVASRVIPALVAGCEDDDFDSGRESSVNEEVSDLGVDVATPGVEFLWIVECDGENALLRDVVKESVLFHYYKDG